MRADLRATWVVARRELIERVRSKWFVAATILGPVFMIAMLVVPALIASSSTAGNKVDVVDKTGLLGQPIAEVLAQLDWQVTVVPSDTPDAVELEKIRNDQINGFISIPEDALDAGSDRVIARLRRVTARLNAGEVKLEQALASYAEGEIAYRGDNASSQGISLRVRAAVSTAVQVARGLRANIPQTKLQEILTPPTVATYHTTGETEGSSGMGAFLIAYILAIILYMVITLYGVAVMRSVVTEKTSRVMEMMVAAVKPRALMAGKILGVGGAGIIQVAVWLGMGAVMLAYREELIGAFGGSGGGGGLPPLAFTEIAIVLLYFVLGFFFYSAMYAAVGAMVSSEQDTQQVQMPVTMLLVIGVLCLQVVSNAPRGSAATIMSNVPLWSPMLMPMRYVLGGATLGEVAISLGILVVSTLLVVRAAAKIYRVGVLMYGKRPGLRELIRWLRY
ncbi:MAG: ABC transporter permease [Deltaproteobacteria bacterium]|nr:ABC transporter permease [Deltaproteobacteria bacterium]